MGANETDVHHLKSIVNPNYEPVFIVCDIKHSAAIFENAGITEVSLHIGRSIPIGLQCMAIPSKRFHHRVAIQLDFSFWVGRNSSL